MKSGRIEAGRNANLAVVTEDQFKESRGPVDVRIDGGHQRPSVDMNRQESGRMDLLSRKWWGDMSGARFARRHSRSEAIEPSTEGMNRDLPKLAELEVGQAGLSKVGKDAGPIVLARGLSHRGPPGTEKPALC